MQDNINNNNDDDKNVRVLTEEDETEVTRQLNIIALIILFSQVNRKYHYWVVSFNNLLHVHVIFLAHILILPSG